MKVEYKKTHRTFKRRKSQEGAVLLMVLLLVILFTGLGLIAMRNTCAELRSAGAHMDKTQAGMIGEAGISVLATDMRLHWDYSCNNSDNYHRQFQTLFGDEDEELTATRDLKFSPAMDGGNADCPTPAGQVPGLNTADFIETPSVNIGSEATLTLAQRRPVCAPCPSGFSGGTTYAWYSFTAISTATYGALDTVADTEQSQIVPGRATARARMTIGPLLAFDSSCNCDE